MCVQRGRERRQRLKRNPLQPSFQKAERGSCTRGKQRRTRMCVHMRTRDERQRENKRRRGGEEKESRVLLLNGPSSLLSFSRRRFACAAVSPSACVVTRCAPSPRVASAHVKKLCVWRREEKKRKGEEKPVNAQLYATGSPWSSFRQRSRGRPGVLRKTRASLSVQRKRRRPESKEEKEKAKATTRKEMRFFFLSLSLCCFSSPFAFFCPLPQVDAHVPAVAAQAPAVRTLCAGRRPLLAMKGSFFLTDGAGADRIKACQMFATPHTIHRRLTPSPYPCLIPSPLLHSFSTPIDRAPLPRRARTHAWSQLGVPHLPELHGHRLCVPTTSQDMIACSSSRRPR